MRSVKKIIKWIFIILAVFMALIQIINLGKEGINRDTLVVVSELLLVIWFIFMYIFRETIYKIMHILPGKWFRFVLLGVISTSLAEAVYIFSKPLHEILFWDLFLTFPWYFLWMLIWFFVLSKFKFSLKEAFILGGFHGFIIEGIFNGIFLNPLLALISLPLFTILYGFFFIVPYLVLERDFINQKPASLHKKFLVSLIPLLAYIPGFIWILSWVKAYGIELFPR